ncbi:Mu transposase C-terminal domain-containing protein [Nocardia sp. NBC_01730]|uniref:Mu transposase C-terminal domain-containing protein n=1 Tax=Nocardia sp. NBC_01730 TaxID=2975998 RepID=UPI002E163929|nr:Mu transposase C-terminal domain-containing protein [Nocardia sp. NBC_01730]
MRVADVTGVEVTVAVSQVLSDPGFELLTGRRQSPLPPAQRIADLPEEVAETARWWEVHVVELLTGRRPDSAPSARVNAEYDPATTTLRQRELAKVRELAAAGRPVSLSTVQRMRGAYEQRGLWGLVDGRFARRAVPTGRTDARVVEAIMSAIAGETDRSTGTVARLRRRVGQLLVELHGADAPPLPPERTFYRLVARLSEGKHTFGSARTRRSLAKQPEGPFGTVIAARPGEVVQIDSTPLDIRVVLDDGTIDSVELTGMVDLATRTVPAAVLRPSTKAVDAALLLARALTPEPMRPGWSDALAMSRSVLPHHSLTEVDQRLVDAAARPVIAPETIVVDHGKAFLSQAFRSACRSLGVSLQPAHPDTPTDKPVIEKTLGSVGTLFAQYVAGYVGSSVERRGRRAEQAAVWSMIELQALLDEWLVAVWQNRPHQGLRDPVTPDAVLTPNEKYAALVRITGYVPVPLSADDYIELLPATWRMINSYGIRINHRTYDHDRLNPYRRQHSGVTAHNGRWEVHYDPYDVSRIWVRNHHDGGWITVGWTHLRTTPVPFGELAWQHARGILAARGQRTATEAEIARTAAELLDRAEQGPTTDTPRSRRDRKVIGRTAATRRSRSTPAPMPIPADDGDTTDPAEAENTETTAKVIPMGIFDPFEEARKRW